MTKGLEALKKIQKELSKAWGMDIAYDGKVFDLFKIVGKELQALEIIKEHWNFEYLKSGFGSKGLVQIKPISIEDANLLIEVLL